MEEVIKSMNTRVRILHWASINKFQNIKTLHTQDATVSRKITRGVWCYHFQRGYGKHIFLTFHHKTRKAPGLVSCPKMKDHSHQGPEWFYAETTWPWNEWNVFLDTVPSAIMPTWYELGMWKQEIITTVQNANMPKNFYRGYPWYIKIKTPVLHAKRTYAVISFYSSFTSVCTSKCCAGTSFLHYTIFELPNTTLISEKEP